MSENGINDENLFPEVDFDSFLDEFGANTESGESVAPVVDEKNIEDNSSGESNDQNLEDNPSPEDTGNEGEDQTESDDDGEGNENENSSPLIPYAKLLVEEGILPDLNIDEFSKDPTVDSLKASARSQIEQGINHYKQSLPPEIANFIDKYEEGVPLSRLLELDNKKAEYSSISDDSIKDNVDLQKSLVREYYKNTTKFSDEKINKLIQRHEDLEELESEAKLSLSELTDLQKEQEEQEIVEAKSNRERYVKSQEELLNNFKKSVNEAKEIIPGMPFNDNVKGKVIGVMTTAVAEDNNGAPINAIAKARIEDPIKFERDLAYLWVVTKGFSDYSSIKSAGKNDAVSDFETSVKKYDLGNKGGANIPRKPAHPQKNDVISAIEDFNRINLDDIWDQK